MITVLGWTLIGALLGLPWVGFGFGVVVATYAKLEAQAKP